MSLRSPSPHAFTTPKTHSLPHSSIRTLLYLSFSFFTSLSYSPSLFTLSLFLPPTLPPRSHHLYLSLFHIYTRMFKRFRLLLGTFFKARVALRWVVMCYCSCHGPEALPHYRQAQEPICYSPDHFQESLWKYRLWASSTVQYTSLPYTPPWLGF